MITQDRLKQLLEYTPETGIFVWKIIQGRMLIGRKAGRIRPDGYIQIKIDGKMLYAHRLAWLFVYGIFPSGQIDHINHIPSDNRIDNLRDVSATINQQNQVKTHSRNKTSNLLGASFNKEKNKFVSRIWVNGKRKHIGYFYTDIEAHNAYVKAKRQFHEGNIL